MTFHLLHGTAIKKVSLRSCGLPDKIPLDARTSLEDLDIGLQNVELLLPLLAAMPRLLPDLQRLSFASWMYTSEHIAKILPMTVKYWRMNIIHHYGRYPQSKNSEYNSQKLSKECHSKHELGFDLSHARGVEHISLRYSGQNSDFLKRVTDGWLESLLRLVDRGHALQRVTMSFPELPIGAESTIESTLKPLEDVFVRHSLQVSIEEIPSLSLSIFPELRRLGLLRVIDHGT